MSTAITQQRLEELRNLRWFRLPEYRVRSEAQALAFVDEVGFAFLFGEKGVDIPTLWGAVCGGERPVPQNHDDHELGITWNLKDTLPSKGLIYYGKLLRKKPTLVTLELLPTFYALSPNYGDEEDYLLLYQEGKLTAEARTLYEVLLTKGNAMPTSHLRREGGMAGGENARRFDRAIEELQVNMMIAKAGISDANRWGYAYVYDLFIRQYPKVPEQARDISTAAAMKTLLVRYLHNVVAVPEAQAKRLFAWEAWAWEDTLERLEREETLLRDVEIEGVKSKGLVLREDVKSD